MPVVSSVLFIWPSRSLELYTCFSSIVLPDSLGAVFFCAGSASNAFISDALATCAGVTGEGAATAARQGLLSSAAKALPCGTDCARTEPHIVEKVGLAEAGEGHGRSTAWVSPSVTLKTVQSARAPAQHGTSGGGHQRGSR